MHVEAYNDDGGVEVTAILDSATAAESFNKTPGKFDVGIEAEHWPRIAKLAKSVGGAMFDGDNIALMFVLKSLAVMGSLKPEDITKLADASEEDAIFQVTEFFVAFEKKLEAISDEAAVMAEVVANKFEDISSPSIVKLGAVLKKRTPRVLRLRRDSVVSLLSFGRLPFRNADSSQASALAV